MPEGDTLYRAARNLDRALAGHTVTEWDLRVAEYALSDLRGESIEGVVSRGKHLLMRVGDFTLHSHLKMEGSWHLYRPGSPWTRPAFHARAVVGTEPWRAVGFELGLLELLPRAGEDAALAHLGPDLLGPDWDASRAERLLAADPAVPVAVALLDQRNLAGLGNEYVNEICFLRGILPTTPIGDTDIPALVRLSHRLILANRDRVQRVTTGDLRPGRGSWVFSRERKPCRRCGSTILRAQLGRRATELRDSYYCPRCQR